MKEWTETIFSQDHIRFHLIPSKKFKTVSLVVKCKAVLNRETITKRALLPYILQQGTIHYPSEKRLMQRLDELYGAVLSIDGSKKGDYHIITFRLEIANEKFLPQASPLLGDALQLMHEIIFLPNKEAQLFPEKIVEREKATLRHRIKSILNDKMAYANMRLIDHMCENERFQLHAHGYEEDLIDLTTDDISAYYEAMLQEDDIDVYVVGDIAEEVMRPLLTETFHRKYVQPTALNEKATTSKVTEVKEIMEEQSIQQAKLHIGYRTNITYQDSDYFALHVCNGLFGGFPSSKLFINVREKNSLAYYAASRLESHHGLLIVFSGIEGAQYRKARQIIELQLKELQAGNFTDVELKNTKELIVSEIKETLDHSQGIVELLYQQIVGKREMSPETFMRGIERVTKADCIRASNQIVLDTVYLLTNRKEESSNGAI